MYRHQLPCPLGTGLQDERQRLLDELNRLDGELREMPCSRMGCHSLLEALTGARSALEDQLGAPSVRLAEAHEAILNSLPAHIAVLDSAGVITWVNEAWRKFGRENGLADAASCVGANYVSICRKAGGEMANIGEEIVSVLRAESASYSQTYRCDAPGELRWFRIEVSPLCSSGMSGAVVMHHNVTHEILAQERLRQSEERFDLAIRGSDSAIWDWNIRTNDLFISPRIVQILECAPEESPKTMKELLRAIHPQDRERFRKATERHFEEGHSFRVVVRAITRSQSERWIEVRGEALLDERRTPHRMAGSITDISEQQRARQQLERVAKRLTETIENIPDAFFIVDHDWRFTHMNDAFERHTRRARRSLLGKKLWEEFPEAIGTRIYEEYQRAVETQQGKTFEVFYPPLQEWFSINACPVSDGLAVYFRNITQRREREERVREHAALLDKAQDAIVVTDLTRSITFWNQSAERVFGWTSEEALGKNADELLQSDPAAAARALKTLLDRGEWNGELGKRGKSGQTVTVESRWSLVHDNDDKPKRILCVITDVSEKRRLEAQFLRAQRMESIGTLASGIAHDLNNTLTPIMMGAAILKEEALSPVSMELLGTIEASAIRASELVRHVLGFAKGYGGARAPLRLIDAIKPIQKIVKDTFPKNIETTVRIPDVNWSVLADATQLHQVLINLVVNARDAMPEGGRLTIAVAQERIEPNPNGFPAPIKSGSYFVLSVTDTGTGIPAEVGSSIFDPFFTTKEQGKGTGLGLATTQSIVKGHGGFIDFESVVGEGSTFKVYLPVHEGQAEETIPEKPKVAKRGRGELILLVEDEVQLRLLAGQALEQAGYRVLSAEDGAEGLALFAQNEQQVSLLITDMVMPQLDGVTMARAALRNRPDLPVVASSGMSETEQAAKAASVGIKRFLPKPYSTQKLLQAVEEALAERSLPSAAA